MFKLLLAFLAFMLVVVPAPSFAEAAPALNPNLPRQTAMMKPRFARAYPKHIKRREFPNATTTHDSGKESPSPDGVLGGLGGDLTSIVGVVSTIVSGAEGALVGQSPTTKVSSRSAQAESITPGDSSDSASKRPEGSNSKTPSAPTTESASTPAQDPNPLATILSEAGSGLGSVVSGVGSVVSDVPTAVSQVVSEVGSVVSGVGSVVSDVPTAVSQIVSGVGSVVSGVGSVVSDVPTAISQVESLITSIETALPSPDATTTSPNDNSSPAATPTSAESSPFDLTVPGVVGTIVSGLIPTDNPLSFPTPTESPTATGGATDPSGSGSDAAPTPTSGPITLPDPGAVLSSVVGAGGSLVGTILSDGGSIVSGLASEGGSIFSAITSAFTPPPDPLTTPTETGSPPGTTAPSNPFTDLLPTSDPLTDLLPTGGLFPPTSSGFPTGAVPTTSGDSLGNIISSLLPTPTDSNANGPTTSPNSPPTPTGTAVTSEPINTETGSPTGLTASSPSAPALASTGTDAQTAPSNSGSASVQPTGSAATSAPVESATSQAQQTAASATLSQAPATTAEASASRSPAPVSLVATASDTQTQMYLPTSLVLDTTTPSTPNPTASTAAASTNGIPSAIPRVIPPPGSGGVLPTQPKDTTLIQIGFQYQLNYPFVLNNPPAIYQIFDILPHGIAFGLDIDSKNVTMQSLQPYDTTRQYGYITTVALAYIPTDNVGNLSSQVPNPAAQLYKNDNSTRAALMSVIDPSFPVIAGQGMNGGDGTTPGGATQTNTVVDQNPLDANNSNGGGVNGTSVGIGVGVVAGAAVYGAAMFFVAKRYKKRKARHSRSSSMLDTSSMVQNGNEQATGATAALMGHSQDGSGGSYGTAQRNLSRNSGGSGSSRGRDISAPVMAENSLGWN